MLTVGLDVGSTTVKASVMDNDAVRWQDYRRHNTKQAEVVLECLTRMESECGLTPGRDRVFMTGSGAGLLAPPSQWSASSMGAIPIGTALYRYFALDIDRPALPNVTGWYERLQQRAAYREHVMLPFDELRGRLAY